MEATGGAVMCESMKEVKTYYVDYICDECKTGSMVPTGMVYPINPPLFVHKCNSCGHEMEFSNKKYPCIKYEEVR